MAFFTGSGIIASDIVRRETQKGVVATFRLQTSTYRNRKLWITVETWGHLAGTVNRHAQTGRSILVNGRLAQRTWGDRKTGTARTSLRILGSDVDLLSTNRVKTNSADSNYVLLSGRVDKTVDEVPGTTASSFTVTTGSVGSKSGRLWIQVRAWGHATPIASVLGNHEHVRIEGQLAFAKDGHQLSTASITRETHPTSSTDTRVGIISS